ncbi:MAG: hypothetical protein HKM95_05635, partial [Inquilinus sp.]|nr:hypothetical protein [Inquilinus sp.]
MADHSLALHRAAADRGVAPRHVAPWLAAAFAAERERWPLWLPAAGGCGILLYFALPAEPVSWAAAIAIGIAGPALLVFRRHLLLPLVLAPVLAAAIGFAAAQWQTGRMAAPMLAAPLGPTWVEGRVVSLSRLPEGVRVVLAEPVVRGLDPAETPRRVR